MSDLQGDARPPAPTRIGARTFTWGERTFVMGILNVTPDSFSGDGLLAGSDPIAAAVAQAIEMAQEGADLLDIGGESTRPNHAEISETEEFRRVMPVLQAVRAALPDMPITIDTTKPGVAMAAILKGADAINDIWGVGASDARIRIAVETGVPIVLMHNRAEPRYADVIGEVVADLRRAVDRAMNAGVPAANVIVDPGIGFGKTAEQNLAVLRDLEALRALGRPILLGTSRKSTLGKVLDNLPPEERVEATVATTALGIRAGVDIVRVHDVRENVRAARIADAIVRGTWHDPRA
ncbi:MAG TPA: dihydropteroate synthase [Candidatus Limnocylindrales bacterium]|nr:dihydropteroate synthase [Candidatus Limnocylindrales bacterium]